MRDETPTNVRVVAVSVALAAGTWRPTRAVSVIPRRMSETESARAVMRSMVAMFDTGDVGAAASIVSPDYVDHQGLGTGEIVGVDGFCRVVSVARSRVHVP